MAAISRRPRLTHTAALALSLLAAACSLVKPEEAARTSRNRPRDWRTTASMRKRREPTPSSRCSCRPITTTMNC